MTFVNLDPSGAGSNTGAVTGTNYYSALSDSSDSTFVDYDYGEASVVALSDLSLPSGAVLLSAQVWARLKKDATGTGALKTILVADSSKQSTVGITWDSAAETGGVAAFDVTDSGLDAATLGVANVGLSPLRVYKAWVRVLYLAQPTVTVTAPTSTVTFNQVTVEWTPSFDVHAASSGSPYEVRVFSSAQYGAGGFDPDVSTATLSYSGTDGATSHLFFESLEDGAYRAYVKVASASTPSQWSDWDYEAFTVDVDKPGNPTVDVTGDNGNGRVAIALDDTAGDVSTTHFQVQRYVGDEGYGDVVSGLDCSLLLPLGATDGLIDRSGNGRDGTDVGGVTVGGVAGPLVVGDEGATDFDGVNDYVRVDGAKTITNFMTNPTFRNATPLSGYTCFDGSTNTPTDAAYQGDGVMRFEGTGVQTHNVYTGDSAPRRDTLAGKTVTFQMDIKRGSGGTTIGDYTLILGDQISGDSQATTSPTSYSSLPVDTWTTVSVTRTMRAGITSLNAYFGYPVGGYMDVRNCMLFEGSAPIPYADPTTDPDWTWSGTPHASYSSTGPFANGSSRTFMGWAYRNTSDTADALLGSSTATVIVRLDSGGNNLSFFPSNLAAGSTWTSAWPGNGEWVHWALTFNEATDTANLYINGEFVSAKTNAVQFPAGASNLHIATRSVEFFDGKQAWVSVHSRALTASEIQGAFVSADGSSWANVRTELGDGMVAFPGSAVRVYDYEAPNGTTVYRARAYNSSVPSYSSWISDTGGWSSTAEWLKCMLDPTLNLSLVVKSYQGFEVPSNTAVHRPLGSSTAIVTGDTPGPEQGAIVLFSKSDTDREALAALLASGSPILLQVPGHPDRCVRFGDRSSQRVVDAAWEDWHEETLGWTVVDRP